MPAGIEKYDSMMSVREVPWHGLGAVLKKRPKSIDEAIKSAGLDWEVSQIPVKLTIDGKTKVVADEEGNPLYFANVRSDTRQPLGIVSKRYTPVQNREAFSFLAGIFGSEMHFETAGSLMNGRRVWVLMKLPTWIEVGGDPIGQYAFISNSHDGKSSVLAAMTPVRIVCQNTEGAALRLAKGANAQRTYTLRHLGNMSQKLAEARNVLDVTVNYYEQFKFLGDKLAGVKVSDQRAKKLLERLLPTNEDMGDRAIKNREESRQDILRLFKEGTEKEGVNTLGASPGTAWGFYNAATEYADWFREERKQGGRFQRSLDDPDGFKSLAWELSLDTANLVA
jgi:phage/plasmid-like protein (TIGR03299 family)